ncbi:MAG: T9SS type A sorting domain-containing protein [Candidatus Syntrophosphaera sp.]|nr:T9SS type A sorting domain-containing protein [Candidatus Syntrophosphaera sp.]
MKRTIIVILASVLLTSLLAQWSSDPQSPNLIAGFTGEQVMPKVAIAPNGNTYLCRFDNSSGSYKVWLQLLSPAGEALWTAPEGLMVSDHSQMSWLTEYDLDVDNDGNAVIVFQDIRSAGTNNVVAYKISSAGTFAWGADGVALSLDTSTDYGNMSPVLFNSSDNSSYAAWQRLGPANTTIAFNRLSAAGQKLWGDNGITLVPTEGSYTWPQITQADGDNILLKYFHDTGPFWSPNRHVYVAKYTPDGQQLWNTVITNAGGLPAWHQLIPFESDGAGGAILAWYEDREVDMDQDVYAQRVTVAGSVTMPANGALISVDPVNQQYYPKLAVDTVNERVYAFYRITDANQNQAGLARQMLDFSGNRLWGDTGFVFMDLGVAEASTVGAYYTAQGAVCLYEFGGDNLGAACWDSSGNSGWPEGPTVIASTGDTKYHFDHAVHPEGWAVLAWEQGFNNMDIYAMRINANGSLGMEYPAPRGLTATLLPPDGVRLDWLPPSLYMDPDGYYIYMNGELAQVVAGDVLTHDITNLTGGNYEFYLKARYGDNYSEPTETVTVIIVSIDEDAVPVPSLGLRFYPNPFRGSAILEIATTKAEENCRISVYDLRGRKLAEHNFSLGSGDHELPVTPEAFNLKESGIYFFQLQLGNETGAIRMVLIK